MGIAAKARGIDRLNTATPGDDTIDDGVMMESKSD
jgi:hypothetical protein